MSDEPIVFVIDDEPMVRESLLVLLELSGFNVTTFDSAEEFLASLEAEQRGCLLLDVRLPGMTGIELQKKLQAEGVVLPVILMSGHASSEIREEGMANGALGFLDKPADARLLIEILRDAINSL